MGKYKFTVKLVYQQEVEVVADGPELAVLAMEKGEGKIANGKQTFLGYANGYNAVPDIKQADYKYAGEV